MAVKTCFRLPLLVLLAIFLGPLSSPCSADDFLLSGRSLYAGQYLVNGGYSLIMQTDCNLVLYDNGRPVWASGTNGRGSNCRASMQRDGNLVIYSKGEALWASNTDRGNGNYVLVLQSDRNVVIYGGSIWSTGTYTYGSAGFAITGGANAAAAKDDTLAPTVVALNATAGEGQLGQDPKLDMGINKA